MNVTGYDDLRMDDRRDLQAERSAPEWGSAMLLRTGILLAAAIATAGAAQAGGSPDPVRTSNMRRAPGVERSQVVLFGPDCADINTRLLSCLPHVYVSPNALGVLQVIDAPPVTRRRPYPELFDW